MLEKPKPSAVPNGDFAWAVLRADPNTGLFVIDNEGLITYANDQAVTFIFGTTEPAASTLVNRSIFDAFPSSFAADRWRAISKVFETGRPVLFRSICKGYQNHSWMHPMHESGEDKVSSVLVVIRRAADDATAESPVEYDYVCSGFNDLGPMEVLTSREIEVMALLGAGQSIRTVAETLKRSAKTVEKHRDSISRKLKVRTRSDLVLMAQQAGLTRADAKRKGK